MSLDLIHYGSYSAWRKNALLIQKIRVLNASEIHEAYFARDLPQGKTNEAIEAFNKEINKWDSTISVDRIATHDMGLYSVTPPNKEESIRQLVWITITSDQKEVLCSRLPQKVEVKVSPKEWADMEELPNNSICTTVTFERDNLKGIQGHSVCFILGLEEDRNTDLDRLHIDISASFTDVPNTSNNRFQVKFLRVEKSSLYITELLCSSPTIAGKFLHHLNTSQITHFDKTLSFTKNRELAISRKRSAAPNSEIKAMVWESGSLSCLDIKNAVFELVHNNQFSVSQGFSEKTKSIFHVVIFRTQALWESFWGQIFGNYLLVNGEAFKVAVSNKTFDPTQISSPAINSWRSSQDLPQTPPLLRSP